MLARVKVAFDDEMVRVTRQCLIVIGASCWWGEADCHLQDLRANMVVLVPLWSVLYRYKDAG